MTETTIDQHLRLRPSSQVMSLERLGSMHPSRLSFVRTLIRQMLKQQWKISCQRFDLDADGHGAAIYRLQTPNACYHGVIFSRCLPDEVRSDRVIAAAWDVTFGVVEGDVDDLLLQQMADNIPLQEAGRQNPRVLVLSRANKSVRNFTYFVDALAKGEQPQIAWLRQAGYLYRTTAVYGNGKFGIADFARLKDNDDFKRPFSAQMLAVYLLRHFSVEQVEHLARARSPDHAVSLDPAIRRYVGIGNSTGLGMAPFLINHPKLIQQWVYCREWALARALGQAPAEADRARLLVLCRRVSLHISQTCVEDPDQAARNRYICDMWPVVINWLEEVPLDHDLWRQLMSWAQSALSLEAQELLVTLLIELYPEFVDELEDDMGADETLELTPDMPVIRLRQIIETRYDWALAEDFAAPEARYWFWYRSVEKEEPRLGIRFEETGHDREMPLAISPRIQQMYLDLCAYLARCSQALVIDFLMVHPEHKSMVRRVQTMNETAYGDIRANLLHREMKPMHLLRTKLSFFGASRFDPKSDRWVRITLFQGAPLVSDFNDESRNEKTFDDWSFPVEPIIAAAPGRLLSAGRPAVDTR